MYTNTVITFSVITGIEALIICVGNAFVIFVFWTQFTGSRRRASYLLINVAVADFLIGVTKIPAFITNSIPSLMRKERSGLGDYIAAFVILFSTASVVSLATVQWNALQPSCGHLLIELQVTECMSIVLLSSG